MYSEIILNRLNNLTYLKPLKGSNITCTSKKNNYNDIVKFYAKIDNNEVIQNISFKATGCTYFLVYCDYFCSLAEGKSLKDAGKIDAKKLYTLMELNDSKNHVIDIILSTFQLLIKKYKKGLEKGTISPIEMDNKSVKESKSVSANEKTSKTEKTISKEEKPVHKKDSSKVEKTSTTKANSLEKNESKANAKSKNETKVENVKHLSSMLSKINSKKTTDKKSIKSENSEEIPAINDKKDNKKVSSNKKNEAVAVETRVDKTENKKDINEKTANAEKSQKKGLFSWFRKNK